MPRGDRTGPLGMGPMTGRAAGYCAGYPVPGYMNPSGGRGIGMAWGRGYGRGGGRGFGRGFGVPVPLGYPDYSAGAPYVAPYAPTPGFDAPYAPVSDPGSELDALKQQADYLVDTLDGIKKRIEELEKESSEKK